MHRMSGREEGQLKDPTRIWIDADGDIWFTDTSNHRVLRFGHDLKFKEQYRSCPNWSSTGRGGSTATIALVAIADSGHSRVVLLDHQGRWCGVIGRHGVRPGEFADPRDLRFGRTVGSMSLTR